MDKIETFIQWIKDSNHIVFFGGAGVSTESGLKDFRSRDGLYYEKYDYPPEEILSHTFFMTHPKEFFQFYKEKLNTEGFSPNITHLVLSELEKRNKLTCIVTQNIDGFHQMAGSKNVLELHGSIHRNHCIECGKSYDSKEVFHADGIPICTCGGIIKPDIVLYEEGLDSEVMKQAIQNIQDADLLIVGGTSLNVYPAASFIHYFRGKHFVLINRDATSFDSQCDLVIHDSLGKVFEKVKEEI